MSEAGIDDAATAEAPVPERSFVERLLGVLRLDGAAYEEIAADPGALGQAVGVVAAAALARGLTAAGGPFGVQGLAFAAQVAALWPVTAVLVWLLGTWFGHAAPFARVARVLGFAMAPLVLSALFLFPVELVQVAVAFLSTALLIATLLVGTRHALQTTTGRAAFVCLVALLFLLFFFMLLQYVGSLRG